VGRTFLNSLRKKDIKAFSDSLQTDSEGPFEAAFEKKRALLSTAFKKGWEGPF
jgi:hypothetical protein